MEPVATRKTFQNISCGVGVGGAGGSASEIPPVTNKDLLPQASLEANRLLLFVMRSWFRV